MGFILLVKWRNVVNVPLPLAQDPLDPRSLEDLVNELFLLLSVSPLGLSTEWNVAWSRRSRIEYAFQNISRWYWLTHWLVFRVRFSHFYIYWRLLGWGKSWSFEITASGCRRNHMNELDWLRIFYKGRSIGRSNRLLAWKALFWDDFFFGKIVDFLVDLCELQVLSRVFHIDFFLPVSTLKTELSKESDHIACYIGIWSRINSLVEEKEGECVVHLGALSGSEWLRPPIGIFANGFVLFHE